ncbi:hypothetical protein CKA32_004025 [Geitlerinema sp. FC II]|nr:hypothetical protein CKA32_004025 [Geitlerinema sp. FC II]
MWRGWMRSVEASEQLDLDATPPGDRSSTDWWNEGGRFPRS